jgi:hypothetical protein
MSIPSVKSATDVVSPTTAARPAATGPDFAALAASLARSDLAGARAAITTGSPAAHSDDLSASVVEGNLAAARVMLGTLGASVHDSHPAKIARDERPATATNQDGANSAPADPIPDATRSAVKAQAPAGVEAKIQDVGSVVAPAQDVDVAAVLRALATGNAGSIPAEVINRYGPGGELYDPAAIMDAYRSSALGQSQMAATAWIGKPV